MASSGLAQDGGGGKLAAPVLVEAFEEGLQEAIETGLQGIPPVLQKDFCRDARPVAAGTFL